MERLADVSIIAAGPGDAAGLARVHVEAWRETYAGLLPAPYLAAMDVIRHARRWRRQLTLAPEAEIVLVAEGRDGLVGYSGGLVLAGRPAMGLVNTLYLLRSAQGAGLGRGLLGAMARVLAARGAGSLQLWVLEGNARARGF